MCNPTACMLRALGEKYEASMEISCVCRLAADESERLHGIEAAAKTAADIYEAEIERQRAEIRQLRVALRKIAHHDYTKLDEMLTDSKPAMIWEAVARAALAGKDG